MTDLHDVRYGMIGWVVALVTTIGSSWLGSPSQCFAGEDPTGFRGLDWGSEKPEGMKEIYAASRPIDCATYSREADSMDVGGEKMHRIEYIYHEGKLVAVSLTAFGDNEALRQIVGEKFGPLEPVLVKSKLGDLPGWPFNARNGLPIDGTKMLYKKSPNTTISVFSWDSGGTMTKVILMSTKEAERRVGIRQQLLKSAGSGF